MTKELNFEESISRLEAILSRMNASNVPLDESLKLFEEADRLILTCSKRLHDAEKKVEVLLKNRQGELVLDDAGKPLSERMKEDE